MPRRRRRWSWILLTCVALAWCLYGRTTPRTLGTFNIRMFDGEQSDVVLVARAIAELNVDAFAVQEILDVAAFAGVLRLASEATGRVYTMVMVPYCPTSETTRRLSIGVVYDARRFQFLNSRAFAGEGKCARDQPHGVVAVLRDADDRDVALASVHMRAGGKPADHARRRRQWAWLIAALPGLTRELGAPIVVAGDVNSTGYLDVDSEERRFIDGTIQREGLQLPTGVLGCTEYWRPSKETGYVVSLLDHVIAPAGLRFGAVEVLGMCAALACRPQAEAPPGFMEVSDHCPVRVTLRD